MAITHSYTHAHTDERQNFLKFINFWPIYSRKSRSYAIVNTTCRTETEQVAKCNFVHGKNNKPFNPVSSSLFHLSFLSNLNHEQAY